MRAALLRVDLQKDCLDSTGLEPPPGVPTQAMNR